MSKIGFNPEPVLSAIDPMMALIVQANTPLTVEDTRNILDTVDLIEAVDLVRRCLLDQITPEEVQLDRGKAITVHTGKKYRKDKDFVAFWNDVVAETEDAVYTHFTRRVELSTGTKHSVHPMIRRIFKLLLLPAVRGLSTVSPEAALKILDAKNEGIEAKDIFGYMSRFLASGSVELHPENILVARKLLQKKCNPASVKHSRLEVVRNAVEKVQQDKYEV